MYDVYDPTIWNTWSNTQDNDASLSPAPSSSTWDSLVKTLGGVVETGIKTYGDIYKAKYLKDMKTVPSNQSGLIIERTGYPINRTSQTGITTQIPVREMLSQQGGAKIGILGNINQNYLLIGIGTLIFLFIAKGLR